ncbi:MAG: SMP-30/gluconolactonase/LRE family protein [Carbonactinosporaceae bacterium]
MRELTATRCWEGCGLLSEGAGWDARRGELQWVDITAGRFHRARVSAQGLTPVRTYRLDRPVGVGVPASGGGWLLGAGQGFVHLGEDGTRTDLEQPERPHATRMNDGACDPQGRFWAGSMSIDERSRLGRLYRCDLDGSVHVVLDGVTISNGLGWSLDGETMYFIDTPRRSVDAFDFEAATGTLAGRRSLVELPPGYGLPDGLTMDDEGCLWVAFFGGSAVRRFTPGGRLDAVVRVPVTNVTSCCFGGADRATLFVTTARHGLDPAQLAAQPDAGCLFSVRPGVTGPARAPYRGAIPGVASRP